MMPIARHWLVCLLVCLLVGGGTSMAAAHNLGFTAMAVPLDSIVVDGDLADWPTHVPVYRIETVLKGYPNYDGSDPEPEDLTATFRIAWSPPLQRLFVAIVVRDDRRELGSGPSSTDAVELYLDGTHGQADPQQYLMFPGDATYAPFGTSKNPTLSDGDIDVAGGRGAWTVVGDTIVYEWSLQVFEAYPDRRAHLEAGRRIGFDVTAVDKDVASKGATWLSWSPGGGKVVAESRLGDIVLVSKARIVADMARIDGRVVLPETDDGWRGLTVRLFDANGKIWGAATSGPGGAFQLLAPPGDVRLEVPDADPPTVVEMTVARGERATAVLPVLRRLGARLPTWPFTTTLGIFGLVSLGALWPLRRRLGLLGGALVAPEATFCRLARQPEWTAPAAMAVLAAALISVASVNQYPGQLWGALMGMPGALSTVLMMGVPLMMFLALVLLQFTTWLAWAGCLWAVGHTAGAGGRFFHIVSIAGYAGIPGLLGLCLAALGVVFGFGGDDPSRSHFTGLALWPLADGASAAVLARLELFTLWSWGLGGLGLACVTGATARRAAAVTAASWALTLVAVYVFHAAVRSISAGLAASGM